jgi:hypothetical protein
VCLSDEFLIGIVPFLGGSPEELFTNIINEEAEYPEGEEALDADAESLIQMLLEKNPVDRLGSIGGASGEWERNFPREVIVLLENFDCMGFLFKMARESSSFYYG